MFYLYNSLSRSKEVFEPFSPPFVGLYVCGPTVYGPPHLGHARPAIVFDLLFRYLKHSGYNVRYVRNITDVGHLEQDADEGEDKIIKKARLEKLEPMEVVQFYTNLYRDFMRNLNVLPPSIEPAASGHIIEQQQLIEKIIQNGFAYESNGSVYFDVEKYNTVYQYGRLSGRILDDLYSFTRELEGKHEKRNSFDFALWKKADSNHIMKWPSVWSEGFPGWHLECSAMSSKYLGEQFDIHGGGIDLQFPHHECEIAQSIAATGKDPVKYWMHNNLITINGQKMSKSLNNYITLEELFNGSHQLLEKAYNQMVIRFFILQAHYRSTLDFSNDALQAAEKGLERLMNSLKILKLIKPSGTSTMDVQSIKNQCYEAMNDDLNSPVAISVLFDGVRQINSVNIGSLTITQKDLDELATFYHTFIYDILGLQDEKTSADSDSLIKRLVNLILQLRTEAKTNKDYANSDKIRNLLIESGISVKDTKDGVEWEITG